MSHLYDGSLLHVDSFLNLLHDMLDLEVKEVCTVGIQATEEANECVVATPMAEDSFINDIVPDLKTAVTQLPQTPKKTKRSGTDHASCGFKTRE
jgi:hypothetical protein